MPTIDDRVYRLERIFNRLVGGGVVAVVSILALFGIAKWYDIPSAVKDAVPSAVDAAVPSAVNAAVPTAVDAAVQPAVANAVPSAVKTAVEKSLPQAVQTAIAEYVDTQDPDLIREIQVLESRARKATEGAEDIAGELQALLDAIRAGSPILRVESGEISFTARNNSPPGTRGITDKRIQFDSAFGKTPKVVMALTYVDHLQGTNLRLKAIAKDVDKAGFTYDLVTWADTKIYRAKFSWIAYGY